MIPTMLLFGLVLGRWPRMALAAAAVLWPALLLSSNGSSGTVLLGGALLGAANAGIGVLVHQLGLQAWRHLSHPKAPAPIH
jgi:hypothetical protein